MVGEEESDYIKDLRSQADKSFARLSQIPENLQSAAENYGLSKESLGYPLTITPLREDIRACMFLETFSLEPAEALEEYGDLNWDWLKPNRYEMFQDFKEYPFYFSQFVDFCRASVVYSYIAGLEKKAEEEKQRILNMTEGQWNTYSAGRKWSQSDRAEDVKRNVLFYMLIYYQKQFKRI